MKIEPHEYAAILAEDRQAFLEETFGQIGNGAYAHNWHIDAINDYMQAIEDDEIDRLIINMPPRSMKSIAVSIAWPAWLLGHNPRRQIIVASHSARIGKELSTKTASVMQSEFYKLAFPHTRLTKETEEWFKTSKQGHRLVATVGNKVTGFGADYLIIDDPIDPESAMSEADRLRANRWLPSTLFSRANNPDNRKIVLVMQRLHEDDPSGMFLKAGGWEHLNLPVEAKRTHHIVTPYRKFEMRKGETLHPERFTRSAVEELKKDLGAYTFSGQYMQHPAPVGGGEFKVKWIQYYNNLSKEFTAKGMNVYILVDPASGKKRQAQKGRKETDQDYTAMMVVGLHADNNYYLLDIIRDRLNPTERINALIKLHKKWAALSGGSPKVGYEDYGMQSDLHYLQKAQSQLNYRFSITPIKGRLKKEDRIRKLIPMFEEHRVYLPRKIMYDSINGESVELVKKLVDDEMMTFPVGKHDDMLDAFARVLDDDIYASFPQTDVQYIKSGQSYRDTLLGDFKEDEFMTW